MKRFSAIVLVCSFAFGLAQIANSPNAAAACQFTASAAAAAAEKSAADCTTTNRRFFAARAADASACSGGANRDPGEQKPTAPQRTRGPKRWVKATS